MTDITTEAQEMASNNIIGKLVEDCEQRVTTIDSDIVIMEAQLKDLRAERETIKKTLKGLKA